MKIAIIGTGLAGLAAGWFLTESGCHVTFFDKNGIGQGASGIAAGLLHPYVGEQTRRSLWAHEALNETKALLLHAAPQAILQGGIIRVAQDGQQEEALNTYDDVEALGNRQFLIHSGLVVDMTAYLQALFSKCSGAVYLEKEIEELGSLSGFDHIVVAAGHEFLRFFPQMHKHFSKIKGQVVQVRLGPSIRTMIAKGYLAKSSEEGVYHWGATYERGYTSETPDLAKALQLLQKNDLPLPETPEILDCKAGVRLARRGHYLPYVGQVKENVWGFAGLGSRGLLYHAYLGKKLAAAICKGDVNQIPKECRFKIDES